MTDNYRMTFDYHTHTIFSHGKGTIEDNVEAGRREGLAAIAITDHGPGHLTYGIKRSSIPEMRAIIDGLNQKYDDIDIYLGVEANIVDNDNGLDVGPQEASLYDFLIGGYHYGVTKGYCLGNWTLEHGIIASSARRAKLLRINTDMAVKAIYENDLKTLTHPGDKGPFDTMEMAKACEATQTYMEISSWHDNLTVEQIKIAAKTDVEFIIGSDAHHPDRVASIGNALERAVAAGLDLERIVNIEKK